MTDMEMAMIRALAEIDRELGMPDDGCNSTENTITAIRLLHAAHRDDAAEVERLQTSLRKLEGTANCGTADSFLALSDDDKRKWFALSIRESIARKKAETGLEELHAAGSRLALELECLLMDTKDTAVQSRWWNPAMDALQGWQNLFPYNGPRLGD
ncbi:MAG: hypothetical protein WBK37_02385 [Kiritimatiellia bacterium]